MAQNATGIVELADSAWVDFGSGGNTAITIGRYAGSYGRLELSGNSVFTNDASNAQLLVGRQTSEGELKIGGDSFFSIHGRTIVGEGGGRGRLEIAEGGRFRSRGVNSSGILIGYNDSGSGISRGEAVVSGSGSILALGSNAADYGNTKAGISVGRTVPKSGEPAGTTAGAASGRLVISGGGVTNNSHLAVGWGMNATGVVEQTGGQLLHGTSATLFEKIIIGFGGGDGAYLLKGGELKLGHGNSRADLYAGGFPDGDGPGLDGGNFNASQRATAIANWHDTEKKPYNKLFMEGKQSHGLFRVDGGALNAKGRNVFIGAQGLGELEIGASGSIEAQNLTLCGGENRASVMRFEFGADGRTAAVKLDGTLKIEPGARLELQCGNMKRRSGKFTLVEAGAIEGAFDPANVQFRRGWGEVRVEGGKLVALMKGGLTIIIK